MATYLWSTLTNGSTLDPFDPAIDVLKFDDVSISASMVQVLDAGASAVTLSSRGKSVTLGVAASSITTNNVQFEAELRAVSTPVDSNDGPSHPVTDGVWSVSAAAPPLDVDSGIGWILNRTNLTDFSGANFAKHDHVYTGGGVPDPSRSVVTYTFASPVILDRLDMIEHLNGVTAVHAYIGNGPGSMTDLGEVVGSLGSALADGAVNTFEFNNPAPGRILTVEISQTALNFAYAFFRMYPTTVDPQAHGASKLVIGDNAPSASGDAFGNVLSGGPGSDQLIGLGGNDRLNGGAGNDVTDGGPGDDWHIVDSPGDRVVERVGEGTLDRVFSRGSYTLTEGAEIELLSTDNHAGSAAIALNGNALDNVIYGNAGANELNGAAGNDRLVGWGGADALRGMTGNDVLDGRDGADVLDGGADNDRLYGGPGDDQMIGGAGSDWFFVEDAGDVVVDGIGEGTLDRVFTSVSYTLSADAEIEIFSTTFHAGTGALDLTGNALANLIDGNAGANVIGGREGNDRLYGFGGSDSFLFDTALNAVTNVDRIGDFDPANDSIRLDHVIFSALSPGALPAAEFTLGAVNANQHIVYDSPTGRIFYDADGLRGGSVQFATVVAGLALTEANFTVV